MSQATFCWCQVMAKLCCLPGTCSGHGLLEYSQCQHAHTLQQSCEHEAQWVQLTAHAA